MKKDFILKFTLKKASGKPDNSYTICYYSGLLESSALLSFWKNKFGWGGGKKWTPVSCTVSLPSDPSPDSHIHSFTF